MFNIFKRKNTKITAYYHRVEFVNNKEPVYQFSTPKGLQKGTMQFMKSVSNRQIEWGQNDSHT